MSISIAPVPDATVLNPFSLVNPELRQQKNAEVILERAFGLYLKHSVALLRTEAVQEFDLSREWFLISGKNQKLLLIDLSAFLPVRDPALRVFEFLSFAQCLAASMCPGLEIKPFTLAGETSQPLPFKQTAFTIVEVPIAQDGALSISKLNRARSLGVVYLAGDFDCLLPSHLVDISNGLYSQQILAQVRSVRLTLNAQLALEIDGFRNLLRGSPIALDKEISVQLMAQQKNQLETYQARLDFVNRSLREIQFQSDQEDIYMSDEQNKVEICANSKSENSVPENSTPENSIVQIEISLGELSVELEDFLSLRSGTELKIEDSIINRSHELPVRVLLGGAAWACGSLRIESDKTFLRIEKIQ